MSFTNNIETAECNQEWEITTVNHDKSSLTFEKLRSFEGMEDIAKTEADEIIHSVKNLCAIIYDFMSQPCDTNNTIIMNTNPQKLAA